MSALDLVGAGTGVVAESDLGDLLDRQALTEHRQRLKELDHELAEAVLAEAIDAPPTVVSLPDATKTVAGLKFRRRWLWRYAGGPKNVTDTPQAVVARTMAIIPHLMT